jgi:hypothetical protein
MPHNHKWFSVVDLKDFFCACPLAEESWDLFAFKWEEPQMGKKQTIILMDSSASGMQRIP